MLNVSDIHRQLAESLTRQVQTQVIVETQNRKTKVWSKTAEYTENDNVISYTITAGNTSGSFKIGVTNCSVLNIVFLRNTYIPSSGRLKIYIRFVDPADIENITDWIGLGIYYIDTIVTNTVKKTVTAADKMLQLEKNYKSQRAFPLKLSHIFGDIVEENKLAADSIVLTNDPGVAIYPLKGRTNLGTNLYYSFREMIGYTSVLQGSSAYFDRDENLKFTGYEKNPIGFKNEDCFNIVENNAEYDIGKVIWEDTGVSERKDTADSYKKIYFQNPLSVSLSEKTAIVDSLDEMLIGKNVRSVSLTKQGTGFYDIGETVEVENETGGKYEIIIGGISYSMSDGGFKETLYSLAESESQSNYDSISNDYSGGNGLGTTIKYTVNPAPVKLRDTFQTILEMQFSSSSGATAVFFTLNPKITAAGDLYVKIVIDTIEKELFTHICDPEGSHVVSITYPLIGLANGGHTVLIQVAGTATGDFDNENSYMVLIGNGVLAEATWDGTIQNREELDRVPLYSPNHIGIRTFSESQTVTTQIPVTQKEREEVGRIPIRELQHIGVNGFYELFGGNDLTFIEANLKLFYTKNGERFDVKQIHYEDSREKEEE